MHSGTVEKESVQERTQRFFVELRKAFDEAVRNRISGEVGVSVTLNAGSPVSRVITVRDTSR